MSSSSTSTTYPEISGEDLCMLPHIETCVYDDNGFYKMTCQGAENTEVKTPMRLPQSDVVGDSYERPSYSLQQSARMLQESECLLQQSTCLLHESNSRTEHCIHTALITNLVCFIYSIYLNIQNNESRIQNYDIALLAHWLQERNVIQRIDEYQKMLADPADVKGENFTLYSCKGVEP